MAKKEPEKSSVQRTVTLTSPQDEQITKLARKRGLGETRAQVMRVIVDAGLRALENAS